MTIENDSTTIKIAKWFDSQPDYTQLIIGGTTIFIIISKAADILLAITHGILW